jgi:hypothetical protein
MTSSPSASFVQPVEDVAGTGTLVAEAVAHKAHLPLVAAAPREGDPQQVDHAIVEGPPAGRTDDRGVVAAQDVYREGHDRPCRRTDAGMVARGVRLHYRSGR